MQNTINNCGDIYEYCVQILSRADIIRSSGIWTLFCSFGYKLNNIFVISIILSPIEHSKVVIKNNRMFIEERRRDGVVELIFFNRA